MPTSRALREQVIQLLCQFDAGNEDVALITEGDFDIVCDFSNVKIDEVNYLVPEVLNKPNIVKEIKTIGLKEARNIKMVDRVTPTAGREMNILRQLFGNIGRFEGSGGGTVPGK